MFLSLFLPDQPFFLTIFDLLLSITIFNEHSPVAFYFVVISVCFILLGFLFFFLKTIRVRDLSLITQTNIYICADAGVVLKCQRYRRKRGHCFFRECMSRN